MSSTEIRRANIHDFSELTDIWFNASVKAHDFIPETYWENNKIQMQNTYLPMSEVYLVENTSNIYGFIALVENTIAAIFVSPEQQGKGIGRKLLSKVEKHCISQNILELRNHFRFRYNLKSKV